MLIGVNGKFTVNSDWNDQHVVKISSILTLRCKSYVIFKEIVLIGRGSLA